MAKIPTAAASTVSATSTTATAAATATSQSATHHGGVTVTSGAAATSAHFNGHDNGPILYDNLNRTSAIDDIRSVVIYIFIITIFLSFFLILPGIRSSKFPTFLCIITSLLVTSIIVISLNGTTWHVGEAPISAPYKAFSRDRIQGDLGVRIGLQSVNISLKAHKYYILHATDGPMIMENTHKYSLLHQPLMVVMAPVPVATSQQQQQQQDHHQHQNYHQFNENLSNSDQSNSATASTFIHQHNAQQQRSQQQTSANDQSEANNSLADELLAGRTSDGGVSIDTELDADEPFATDGSINSQTSASENQSTDSKLVSGKRRIVRADKSINSSSEINNRTNIHNQRQQASINPETQSHYTVKRVYVDINYNERFYWIEPMQMRREYQQALERGLPYPILTVVEYLSQDDAGFSWSRQYRAAGYYTTMLLWVSASVCVLMFCLHCAAPKYGIYAMQALGVLLLLTNLNYATLVPRGDQKLVIPFEGQSLTFRFGWNFWLVLVGGCLSLLVGTIIVIIDRLFPNFIFTTVLDVDFDSTTQKTHIEKKYKILGRQKDRDEEDDDTNIHDKAIAIHTKPKMPPFMHELKRRSKEKKRSNDEYSTVEKAPSRKTLTNAVGVKLNAAYLSEGASENTKMSKYDNLIERNQALISMTGNNDGRSNRQLDDKSTQDEQMIASKEQTIRL